MVDNSQTREDSLAKQAYQELRRALRDGGISPRRFYSETEFAELLGVSRTPVREALKALEREGVMVAAHRRGYRIREFTTSEINEIAAVREQLEVLVARTLAASRTQEDLDRLGDILRRQDEDTEAKCIFALDEEFHLTSAELAGLHRTRDLLAGLRSVRAAIIAGVVVPREMSALRVAEHHQILAAITAGDRRDAVRLMRAHVRASEQAFLDALQAATANDPMIKPLNRGPSPAPPD